MIIKTVRISATEGGARLVATEMRPSSFGSVGALLSCLAGPVGCLVSALILVSGCGRDKTQALLQAPQALGVVLAGEAALLAGTNRTVGVITPNSSWGPVSTVEISFREAIEKRGFSVITAKSADLGSAISFAAGLDGADFLEALQEAHGAGALVSFGGAPVMSPAEAERVTAGHPPVLVVATMTLGTVPGIAGDRRNITNLLDAKIIQMAVIDGADESNAQPAPADAAHEIFARNYRFVRPAK